MCWANKSYSDPNYLFIWPIIFLTPIASQNKLKRRWRILLSLLFFGYIFSVSYVSLRESGILQDAMASFSCWLFKLQCVGRINRILTPIIYLFGQLFF
jgi:hypothetical protein